jgi:hypothetical protein
MENAKGDFKLQKDSDFYATGLCEKYEAVALANVGSATYVGGSFSAIPLGFQVQSAACDTAFLLRMGTALGGANGTVSFTIAPKAQPYYVPCRATNLAPFECAAVAAAGTLNIQALGYIQE